MWMDEFPQGVRVRWGGALDAVRVAVW